MASIMWRNVLVAAVMAGSLCFAFLHLPQPQRAGQGLFKVSPMRTRTSRAISVSRANMNSYTADWKQGVRQASVQGLFLAQPVRQQQKGHVHKFFAPFTAFFAVAAITYAVARQRLVQRCAKFAPVELSRSTGFSKETVAIAAMSGKKASVVISPSYNLAIGTAVVALGLAALPGSGLADAPAAIFALLAALFAVQTGRVKFCFDNEALELKVGDDLQNSGENIVVGGANRWKYSSFVNWDIFPSRSFPILVYFKENQTPAPKWNEGPGKLDKVGGGQIHFFPAVCNVEEICGQFEARKCKKIPKA